MEDEYCDGRREGSDGCVWYEWWMSLGMEMRMDGKMMRSIGGRLKRDEWMKWERSIGKRELEG